MSTIIRPLVYALLALAGWTPVMIALPFFGPAGRQVAVVGDAAGAVRAVAAAGGRVIEVRGGAVIARADPAALYRAGAWLVIEARLASGCGISAGE